MDSVTHIVLGACIGEAVAGKRLGRRALFLGALAQSIPDIDFLAHFWLSESENLLAHRGITHSFLFGSLATILLVALARRIFRKDALPDGRWVLLFGLNIFTHIFIDSLNAYGTGWFEPFSHRRVSFHLLFVADPLFTIGPLLACLALTYLRRNDMRRKRWWRAGLLFSAIYLCFALFSKVRVDHSVRATLRSDTISQQSYFTTPTPFNTLLWFVVIRSDSGYYAGHQSVFARDSIIDLSYFPQNNHLLAEVSSKKEASDLQHFSEGYYTVEKWNDTTVFNVLRFGQMVGWHDPKERFVFHYFLDQPGANRLVTQRGRLKRWNRETLHSLWERIRGREITEEE